MKKLDLIYWKEERNRLAEETLLEQVEQLRDLVYEQPDNLDQAAEQLNLSIQTTGLFDRNQGQGIASSTAIRDAAFSEEVLVDEINSEPIEINDEQYVVIHKADYQASQPRTLESVREEIVTMLRNQKAVTAAQQAGDEILHKARLNWQAVKDDELLSLSSHTIALADNSRAVVPEVMKKVTAMQLDDGSPSVASVTGGNGDFYIIRLNKITPGEASKVSEQVKDSTRRALAQRNGQALIGTYLDTLGKTLTPQINNDLL